MSDVVHIADVLKTIVERLKEERPDDTPERPEHLAVVKSIK